MLAPTIAAISKKELELEAQRDLVASLQHHIEVKHDTIALAIGNAKHDKDFPVIQELRGLEVQLAAAISALTQHESELEVLHEIKDHLETVKPVVSESHLYPGVPIAEYMDVIKSTTNIETKRQAIELLHMTTVNWWQGDPLIGTFPRWSFLRDLAVSAPTPEVQKAAQDALVRALNSVYASQ